MANYETVYTSLCPDCRELLRTFIGTVDRTGVYDAMTSHQCATYAYLVPELIKSAFQRLRQVAYGAVGMKPDGSCHLELTPDQVRAVGIVASVAVIAFQQGSLHGDQLVDNDELEALSYVMDLMGGALDLVLQGAEDEDTWINVN